MFRNPKISAAALAAFCRSLSRMLEAGVDVRKSLKTSSAHSVDSRLTPTVAAVLQDVTKGDDLTSSFRKQEYRFPALFLDLLHVGEQTGSLPEVFSSLADYYDAHVTRMREFRSEIAWPVIQLFAAILIIGLLIYVLGAIGSQTPGQPAEDILGLGLVGARGSVIWFLVSFGSIAGIWAGYIVATRNVAGQMALHPFLMTIPGIGRCMQAFAISRFSWCFALTQQAGMPLKPSIQSSLRATANGAYIQSIPHVWSSLKAGEDLATSLNQTGLFPVDYIHFVETAEQSGTVPETLDRLSRHFDEDAHRSLTWLTGMIAKGIWFLVACFIGFIVISFFMKYVALINSFM